jgi:hypothetical protein
MFNSLLLYDLSVGLMFNYLRRLVLLVDSYKHDKNKWEMTFSFLFSVFQLKLGSLCLHLFLKLFHYLCSFKYFLLFLFQIFVFVLMASKSVFPGCPRSAVFFPHAVFYFAAETRGNYILTLIFNHVERRKRQFTLNNGRFVTFAICKINSQQHNK